MWEDVTLLMFKTIFIKNPCKKCLVRACCTIRCEDKLSYNCLAGWNGMGFQKICAYTIMFSVCVLIYSITTIILKYTAHQ